MWSGNGTRGFSVHAEQGPPWTKPTAQRERGLGELSPVQVPAPWLCYCHTTQQKLQSLRDKLQPLLSRQRSCVKKQTNKKTLTNQSKPPSSTRIRRQKLRLASSLSRARPVLPPVLEITVFNSQTHPVCHLSFQRCFQVFLRRSRSQQCFPVGISAFVNRTAFPGMKARETNSSCCKIWKSRATSIASSNPSKGLQHKTPTTAWGLLHCFGNPLTCKGAALRPGDPAQVGESQQLPQARHLPHLLRLEPQSSAWRFSRRTHLRAVESCRMRSRLDGSWRSVPSP